MTQKILSFILFIFCTWGVLANPIETDTLSHNKIKTRSFKQLDGVLESGTLDFESDAGEFDEAYIKRNYPLSKATNDRIDEAAAVMKKLDSSANYVGKLLNDKLTVLPVGIKKEIGNLTYTLAVSKAIITPDYAMITAFVRVTTGETDKNGNQKQLFFGAENLKLSYGGGIYGDVKLVLLGNITIPINGGKSMIILNGGIDMDTGDFQDKTYAVINCDGFKEMGINADVVFSEKMLQPVDKNYNRVPDKKVTGHFETKAKSWNDILIEIDLPNFQLTKSSSDQGKGGLIFKVERAVFDFSDTVNSDNVKFPKGYDQYLPDQRELWRGVYIKEFMVVLPKQFRRRKDKQKDNNERITFKARNFLIDGMGVSGNFSVDNILPLNEGSASKWQFSVDYIEAEFKVNNITSAAFRGKVVLPISSKVTKKDSLDAKKLDKKTLEYDALIDPTSKEYRLTVTTKSDISFNVFKAKATLYANSTVLLKQSGDHFRPKAILHGSLNIAASNGDSKGKPTVDFKGITFIGLELQTEKPYFKIKHMGYTGKVGFTGFPVTLSDIHMTSNNNVAALHFNVAVNLMSKAFAGNTSLSIVGEFDEKEGLHTWQYKEVELTSIGLEGDLGSIKIRGSLTIKENDPVYGDGFYGTLGATFTPGIGVDVSAWFGSKDDFRYWYLDAYADLSKMVPPLSIPPIIFTGFGGGAYYHMSKDPSKSSLGVPSGLSYVPDKETLLGFRALIGLAFLEESALNAKVGFEMEFNNSGGLNRMSFFGEAALLKGPGFGFGDKFKDKLKGMETKINDFGDDDPAMKKLKETNLVEYSKVAYPQDGLEFKMGIDANFSMEMDFQNESFHSQMEAYLNTPGGFLQGIGPNGRVAQIIFHIDRDSWYLHAGTPKDRMGIKVGIGGAGIKVSSYLMVGDKIPGSPPPPAIVAEILGVEMSKLDSMRDLNKLGEGSGFAFGMDISMDTGEMNFLMFYASFQAGIGFDIMIKDYGEAACKGSGRIGVDGWYANGQSYVYLQGELGININLLFVSKRIPIMKAGAAALLQAKLPNPSWFRGYLGGHYNLLGGAVKGKFRFKLELGEECELVDSRPFDGLEIISELTPSDKSDNVDVFTVPQVTFNLKIDTPFEFEDDEGIGTYQILLDEYSVTDEDGHPIRGDMNWNAGKDVVNFESFDVLPPQTLIKMKVRVSFKEKKGGSWVTLMHKGKPAKEFREIGFTTGDSPNYIPLSNILYCYPVVDQKYFYKAERREGYVKLKKGQPYLFQPKTDWTQSIRFESDLGMMQGTGIGYLQSKKRVFFNVPDLKNKEKYTMYVISTPPEKEKGKEKKEDRYTKKETGQEGNTIEVKNKEAETVVKDGADSEVEVLTYEFTTSAYNTFAQKIQTKKPIQHLLEPIYSDVHAIQTDVQPSERFGLVELEGSEYTERAPLINVEATLDDDYYKNLIYPLIYKGYPLEPKFTVDREVSGLGLPPKKGIDIIAWYISDLENDYPEPLLDTRIPYRYHLPFYYKSDFIDIQYKIVNTYLHDTKKYQSKVRQYAHIINGIFPSIQKGYYGAKMQYVLPGGIKGSSSIFKYYNRF